MNKYKNQFKNKVLENRDVDILLKRECKVMDTIQFFNKHKIEPGNLSEGNLLSIVNKG